MKKITLLFIFLISITIHSQRIRGVVLDIETNKPIDDVHIQVDKEIIVTNRKGKFSFRVPKKWNKKLFVSHVSYQEKEIVYQPEEEKFKIYLVKKSISLQEVFVVGNKPNEKLKYAELPDMPKRLHSFASVVNDDKIYVFGGNKSQEFDVAKKALRDADERSIGATLDLGIFLRRIRELNSYQGYNDEVYVYDVKNKTWQKEDIKVRNRASHSASLIGDKVYILGGKRLTKNRRKVYLDGKVEVFDVQNKTIQVDDANPHQAVDLETFTYKNRLIALGGSVKEKRNGKRVYTKKVHSYNPKTGNWYKLAELPIKGEVSTCLIEDKLYFFHSNEDKESSTIASVDLVTGRFKKEGKLLYQFEKPAIAKKDKTIFLFENGKLLTYHTETRELKSYLIDLRLYASKSYFFNDSLYILGGFIDDKIDFELRPSQKLYKIALEEFKKTRIRKYVKL